MRIVCLESPFKPSADDIKIYAGRYSPAELLRQNLVYARLLLLNSLKLGEAPFASHLLYTQVWSESDDLRDRGIKSGIEFHHRADLIVLGIDLGTSSGMRNAAANARLIGTEMTSRSVIDVADGRDPRDILALRPLDTFPHLEELYASESDNLRKDSRA
jgi:hypothetical protein